MSARWSMIVGPVLPTALVLVLAAGSVALAAPAFQYAPIADPIQSATFHIDLAALTAHRTVGGYETNFLRLIDLTAGPGDLDLSNALFGTAAYPAPPQIAMGPVQTHVYSAAVPAWFFPALTDGQVGLIGLLTDTDDAMFAIDFMSLTIATTGGGVTAYYGWPIGNENNGFDLDPPVPDNGDLPDPLPISIPVGATGTGFDETISSKAFYDVPEPATSLLLALGLLCWCRRGRR